MSDSKVHAFTFGEPEPVMNGRDLSQFYETWLCGKYYEPHISMNALAKSFKAMPYLSTAVFYKKNQLVSSFKPNKLINSSEFERIAFDYLVFGNGYLQRIENRLN
jgi:capsid portal protein